ncbi:hypothetical protein BpHYR1_042786, partial [Brachionus plicatilis]
AGGSGLDVLGKTYVEFRIGDFAVLTFIIVVKNLVMDCLLGMDVLPKFPFFKQPIDQLKQTAQIMTNKLTTHPKFYRKRVLQSPLRVSNLCEVNVDHYITKIHELLKNNSAACLKELKPSRCFE